jgi:DNA-binding NtrC family response regulator
MIPDSWNQRMPFAQKGVTAQAVRSLAERGAGEPSGTRSNEVVRRGIGIDSRKASSFHSKSSMAIPASFPLSMEPEHTPGAAELAALVSVLSAVADALVPGGPQSPRSVLEAALQGVLACRAVALVPGPALGTGPGAQVREGGIELAAGPGGVLRVSIDHPFDSRLRPVLLGVAALGAVVLEMERLRGSVPAVHVRRRPRAAALVGSSVAMSVLRERIARAVRTEFPVLIEGESGAGKELVAHQLHETGRRSRGPFVAVNCAALVESLLEAELFGIEDRAATGVKGRRGKFELAHGGTLFLDEVGDLSSAAQAKLLRVLQDMCVERVGGHGAQRLDVRVIAATNRPLSSMVQEGRFRLDLFHRLNCVEIQVPPLRHRRSDIPELVQQLLDRTREVRDVGIAPDALDALTEYDWPGNVRELERVIQRAVTLCEGDRIEVGDLPPPVAGPFLDAFGGDQEGDSSLRWWASRYTKLVLRRCADNKREACRVLNISYHTLQAHLRYRPRPRAGAS